MQRSVRLIAHVLESATLTSHSRIAQYYSMFAILPDSDVKCPLMMFGEVEENGNVYEGKLLSMN